MPPEASTARAEQDLRNMVEKLKRELAEAREQQSATSEILRVISNSQADTQPVFTAIAKNAVRLCNAMFGAVFSFDGRLLHFVAGHRLTEEGLRVLQDEYPISPRGLNRQAIMERAVIHVVDMLNDPRVANVEMARALGNRSLLVVPMLQAGQAIGTINVYGSEPVPFSEPQVSLLRTFADQAVIAIENARLFEEVQARTRELQESLEYQTATGDVLNVISRSPTEVQPVFDMIAQSAARLCKAQFCHVFRFDGQLIHFAASHGLSPKGVEAMQRAYPMAPGRGSAAARAIASGAIEEIPDVHADPDYAVKWVADVVTFRSALAVPMLKEGRPIGAIAMARSQTGHFPERQIELLKTFADQGIIAIENARLFEEVQSRTHELQESLEYQTATSEVLNVISRFPSKLQPVFDAIVGTAARLCRAEFATVRMLEDGKYRLAATNRTEPEYLRLMGERFITPGRGTVSGRTALERRPVHVPDIQADLEINLLEAQRFGKLGTVLGVPLLRGDVVIGTIALVRTVVLPFTDQEIDLVTTFADQAVIAIENTRLFDEVQARTRDLQEALEYQTAVSDVLNVIGRSTAQLQPVLDTIVETAARLCDTELATVHKLDAGKFHLVAARHHNAEFIKYLRDHPASPGRGTLLGRTAFEGRTVHVQDVLADPEYTDLERQRVGKFRTVLGVPLLRDGDVIGVIILSRDTVRSFTEKQIELVTTFADQAVIAIENTRLFEEVQARNRDLTALSEVGRAVSSSLDLKVVLKSVVERAIELSSTDAGSIFYYRKEVGRFELGETSGLDRELVERIGKLDIAAEQTGLGEAIAKREPLQIADVMKRPSNALRDAALDAGLRAALIVPLLGSEGALGALVLQRRSTGEFPPSVVSLMQSFADQSAIALENARLFQEIAQKSRELEVASQHKSQFVANMSHELRTPLAAILGYAELMQEGFHGAVPDRAKATLARVQSNGKHLLGLINSVLDIAKIESGQFSLNLAEYALDGMVETVRVQTESLATAKKLALKTEVATNLPRGLGDEPRLTQVLLNLVGNAIKFTDAGEVRITAGVEDSHFTLAVSDTGPGIPPEEKDRIFEEFHQIDDSNTRTKGGTGLGLAIAKKIVDMHGGRIWVESKLGQGSTFRMVLPVRAGTAKRAA